MFDTVGSPFLALKSTVGDDCHLSLNYFAFPCVYVICTPVHTYLHEWVCGCVLVPVRVKIGMGCFPQTLFKTLFIEAQGPSFKLKSSLSRSSLVSQLVLGILCLHA